MTSKKTRILAEKALYLVNPLAGLLAELLRKNIDTSEDAAESGKLTELEQEARRQELVMHMADKQAKLAQEIAIARRIETADEVEMEEFYDVSGSASAGVKAEGKKLTVGLNAEGQKVTKRIFRFKGGTNASPAKNKPKSTPKRKAR